jgi:hypothetical protein
MEGFRANPQGTILKTVKTGAELRDEAEEVASVASNHVHEANTKAAHLEPAQDDDDYKPIWPSGLWATFQGGETSKTSITRPFIDDFWQSTS